MTTLNDLEYASIDNVEGVSKDEKNMSAIGGGDDQKDENKDKDKDKDKDVDQQIEKGLINTKLHNLELANSFQFWYSCQRSPVKAN